MTGTWNPMQQQYDDLRCERCGAVVTEQRQTPHDYGDWNGRDEIRSVTVENVPCGCARIQPIESQHGTRP